MAAGLCKLYDNGLLKLINGTISLNGNLFAVLTTAAHTVDRINDALYSDISADIVTDADYAPVLLTGKTFTIIPGTVPGTDPAEILIDCDNISFGTTVTISGKYIHIVYSADGTLSAGDHLFAVGDLNTSSSSAVLSSTNGNFAVNTPNGLVGIENTI